MRKEILVSDKEWFLDILHLMMLMLKLLMMIYISILLQKSQINSGIQG